MSTYEDHERRTDDQLTCPVPGCDYINNTVQGIKSHVGHHGDWDAADVEPHDLHENATLRDPAAVRLSAAVKAWVKRNALPAEKFRFYEHQGWGTIYIVTDARLKAGEFARYRSLALETDGVTFSGGESWVTKERAEKLPEPSCGDYREYLGVSS